MEDILFLLIVGGIGLLFMYLGLLLWIKEKINIMHDYHYTIGCLLSGVAGLFIGGGKSVIVFGGSFTIGILMMLYAQIKYNHGLF